MTESEIIRITEIIKFNTKCIVILGIDIYNENLFIFPLVVDYESFLSELLKGESPMIALLFSNGVYRMKNNLQ